MGDEDGGAALHGFAEAGEDLLFGVGVYAGQGVVEDQDGGIAEDGAGDGGALLLAAGESDAALADDGAEAGRELEDLVGDVGGAGGGFDLLCRERGWLLCRWAAGTPKAMLLAMVVEKRKVSWGTKPMAERRVWSG